MSRLDNFAEKYAGVLLKGRWVVLLLTVVASILIMAGAQKLSFSTNYRVFFSQENPQLAAFEEFQNTYTKSDFLSFIVKSPTGDMFTKRSLTAVKELTDDAWKLPYSTRVDSITNYQHTRAEDDDLIVEDLVEGDPMSYSQEALMQAKNIALNEPTIEKRLISTNGQTTQISVTMQFVGDDPADVVKTAKAGRELLAKFKVKYPEFETALSGTVMLNNAFMEASMKDMTTLTPLMNIIILVMLAIMLRSFLGTVATLIVMMFSSGMAMGFGGWMGYPLTPPSASTISIVLTLAIADSVHVMLTMFTNMRGGMEKFAAIKESLRINFKPVLITSATTAIGFMSLNFSDAPPFRHLGNMSAFGVMMAFVLSVTLLPAMLAIMPIRVKVRAQSDPKTYMDKFADLVIQQKKMLLVTMTVLVISLAAMVPKLELNDQFVQYFDKTIEFRTDTEFMIENLTGIYQIEYSLDAKGSGGIAEPLYLKNLEAFSNWLKAQPEVLHVFDQTEVFKRLNKSMHGDDDAYYKLPDSRELAAQYLLLYEMSLPYGLDLNDRINIDKSATRVTVTIDDLSTVELHAFKDRSEVWLRNNTPSYMRATATSQAVMFAYISQRNIDSMMVGNLVSLVSICVIIGIALRSVKMGLFSMAPNIFPAIMAFGVWTLLNGQVNMAVAIIVAVSLGIIVDDTVHFLSKYDRARKEKGLNPEQSVRYAFHMVGSALVITTITLMAGFGVLAFSTFQMNSTMGILTAIAIGFALLVDFLLLPPLLLLFDKRQFNKVDSDEIKSIEVKEGK
ncbi:MAG: putative RND superfamily exporter protein [Alphaproteobacteria bacterium]|jgi:predicted RND superfamily exporter protein